MMHLLPHQKEFVEFRGEYLSERWYRGEGATTAICAKALHNALLGEGTLIITRCVKELIGRMKEVSTDLGFTPSSTSLLHWEFEGGGRIHFNYMSKTPEKALITLETDNVLIDGGGIDIPLTIETVDVIRTYCGRRVKRLHTLL